MSGGKRRKLSNPLALAVMGLLGERPMHPYEIARTLRQRGKEASVKINYGSLYTVVQNLEKHGFVEVTEVQREGNRPERTLYGLTDAGREEVTEWLSDLVAVPAEEFPLFETALSLIGYLPPDEAVSRLRDRLAELDVLAASLHGVLGKLYETLPRLFLVEIEYKLHMAEAQAAWVRGFVREIDEETLSGVEGWRSLHESGQAPPEWQAVSGEPPAAPGGSPEGGGESGPRHRGGRDAAP
ncbi:PadR family transcriptional regulator [Streptomyces sp. 8L]|uniref:PadR family transcriptional regulator n=1 Tax=Streptomyces sp. 8L TaxID=2877242 RepID=UPI001CD4E224|nr:PadR family transcriptional regulator [Streptomyces sp. 8L]MCA1217201.1 PadR family transcriptional regulator [Streptomyces sp. 8L]